MEQEHVYNVDFQFNVHTNQQGKKVKSRHARKKDLQGLSVQYVEQQ